MTLQLTSTDKARLLLRANVLRRTRALGDVPRYLLHAARAQESNIHASADRHVPAFRVALMAAFAVMGRKLRASHDVDASIAALKKALGQTLPMLVRRAMVAGGNVTQLRTAGDVEGHPFHGNQWTSTAHGQASKDYRTSKGTNAEHNKALVKAVGVKIEAPDQLRDQVDEAIAHVADDRRLGEALKDHVVIVTDLGNRHGNSSGKKIYVDQKSLNDHGPGFAATIIRHELEHSILTKQNVPSGQQESRVKHAAGIWAALKYSGLANTNPKAGEGFKKAAIASGIKMRGAELHILKRSDSKPKIDFAFDAQNQSAIDWADRHAAELIDGISETSREQINNAIADVLETGDWKDAIDEILDAVGDPDRAERIARHETMLAVSEGQRQAWDQAVDEGLLDEDSVRTWITVGDGKVCPICDGLDGQTAKLGEAYESDGEEYDGPPAHVSCRCTEGLAG